MDKQVFYCTVCGEKISGHTQGCPKCGSKSKKSPLSFSTSTYISFKIGRMKAVQRLKNGYIKLWDLIDRKEPNYHKPGKFVYKYRNIDKITDSYDEVVIDLETGETIRDCHEKESEHIPSKKKRKSSRK